MSCGQKMDAAAPPSQRGFMEFSPQRKDSADKENDVPVLSLVLFSKAPFVPFGSVKVGSCRSAVLRIENPTDDAEAEVTVHKLPSGKGFSVDRRNFTIQPASTFELTITWTPTEEGGVRELIVFNANGVLKHQAVLLGRAEAPKTKKRTLWDSIKSKRRGEAGPALRGKKSEPPMKMAASRTFQASRKPQYKRDKVRSPLASLNEGEDSGNKRPPRSEGRRPLTSTKQLNLHSPPVLPAPLMPGKTEPLRRLNTTLSPVGSQDSFEMKPGVQSVLPVKAVPLSVSYALAAIDSDLSHGNSSSPSDLSDSFDSSDSARQRSKAFPDGTAMSDLNPPRLTFLVSRKDGEQEDGPRQCLNTATVIKGPAPQMSPRKGSAGRSRRRLLETTLELSDGTCQPSGTASPALPVIEAGRTTPVVMTASLSPPVIFPVPSPATSVTDFMFSSALSPPAFLPPLGQSSPLNCDRVPPASQESLFTVHVPEQSKKRKSGEYLGRDGQLGDDGKMERVKRSRAVPQRASCKAAASSCSARPSGSLRTSRSAAQSKRSSSRPTSAAGVSVRSLARPANVVAVAQSRLAFITPAKTVVPRHPLPFAAKNMFYDERWMEKQERSFTWWINHVLTPDDFKVTSEVTKVSAASLAMGGALSVPVAPTREEMSFSTYTARRKLNRLRRSACQLFTSDAMGTAIRRLELEVEARRLLIRRDRHLWKDIGERQKVVNWLLSYNPLWLRIGLETIFGELIPLQSNSDAIGLAVFILQRLLWNPDIAATYRHPTVPHLYKDGHEEALSRFTLKKLLLLVCFLDEAKESRLMEHNPCLFCRNAEFKSSRDLLLAFSRDFLSGEGILPRHLAYLGLAVRHVQAPLDEFNFAVNNLAVDLKCGIRLARVTELLTQQWSLSAKLRLPAISRLQKIHNVDISLQVLRERGVDLKDQHGSIIDARDIVDGHREKTLGLLWKIIFSFQVETMLNEDQMKDEISFLRKTLRTKWRLASIKSDGMLPPGPPPFAEPYADNSRKVVLLMDWVRAVCDFYGLKVENLTVAFSDGRVLCFLIHHYHPALLPAHGISQHTTQTMGTSNTGCLELDCSSSDLDNPEVCPSVDFKDLLANEKNNFKLVNAAVAFLGGVPAMINTADMSNTIPDKKVVLSYLSFLCVRLLDLRNETRAARLIQGTWRNYRLKRDLQHHKERSLAARRIQVMVRSFLQRRQAERWSRAAIVIQAAWKGLAVRNRLRLKKEAQLKQLQYKAATLIQAEWRRCVALRAYHRLRCATVVMQAQWRMKRAVAAHQRICRATIIIQRGWRAQRLARIEHKHYIHVLKAAVTIQTSFRRWRSRRKEKHNHAAKTIQVAFRRWAETRNRKRLAAAVSIQNWYRKHSCRRRYCSMLTSAVLIQAHVRGHLQRRRYHTLKLQQHAAVIIQSAFRGLTVRRHLRIRESAALIIQRRFRATKKRDFDQQNFLKIRRAAVTIQAIYRGKAARDLLSKQQRAATAIQVLFRKHVAQRRFLLMKKAAVVIQQAYRAAVLAQKTKEDFSHLRKATISIQACWRGRAVRKWLERRHHSATLIQSFYRRHKAQAAYGAVRVAAGIIQCRFRAHMVAKEARETFLVMRAACIRLQAAFHGWKARMEAKRRCKAVSAIQAAVRMFLARKNFLLLRSATIIVQSRYRALRLCREHRRLYVRHRQAAITIQAAYRSFRVRAALQRAHAAAMLVQAHFRMWRQRAAFLAIKHAAILIQERYRAKMLRDQQLQAYRMMKSSAVLIQAAYRGYTQRKLLARMHCAAATIQRCFLLKRDRKRFLALRAAVVACQRRYRATTLSKTVRMDYLSKLQFAVRLQATFRGHRVRKQLARQHLAAITIQTHYRRYLQHSYFTQLRWAVTTVQARYRALQNIRRQVVAQNARRDAAIVLQAAYRGMRSRRVLTQRHQAATVIQAAFRRHRQEVCFHAMRLSTIIIQRWYRAWTLQRSDRHHFLKLRHSAVLLQAAYRGQCVRREAAQRHRAATVIQAAFRRHRQEIRFQAIQLSAIIIQRRYRAWTQQRSERNHFLKLRHSAVILQAAVRGHRVRTYVSRMRQAAVVFQAHFRRRQQQLALRKQRQAATVLQRCFRAHQQRHQQFQLYQQTRHAAIVLQAAYRGMRSRRILTQKHWAASVIQAAFRRHRQEVRYLAMRLSAIIIQRRYRAWTLQRSERDYFLKLRHSAVLLQAAYRGQCVRREVAQRHRAATVIQAAFRSHRQEVSFQAIQQSTIIIQRRYRAWTQQRSERDYFLKLRHSAVLLQAVIRGHLVRTNISHMRQAAVVFQAHFRRRQQQLAFRKQRQAATILQRCFRAHQQRHQQFQLYQQMRHAAIVLQAMYRGMRSRRVLKQRHRAVTVIQAAFRRHRQEVRYLAMRLSAIIIQRRYRAWTLQRSERHCFLKLRHSVVLLQATYRGQCVRREAAQRHRAATVIQAAFRRHRENVQFQAIQQSTVIIQRWYRAWTLRRSERHHFLKLRHSAVLLQAAYRGQCVRREAARRRQAATVIQASWRGTAQRQSFYRKRAAVLKLQRRFRAARMSRKERNQLIRMRQAAILLQKHCRVWLSRRQVLRTEMTHRFAAAVFHHLSAVRIQRAYRSWRSLCAARQQISSIVTIQSWVRMWLQRRRYVEDREIALVLAARQNSAATIIQRAVHRFLHKRRRERLLHGVVKLQALWRGHRSRQLHDNPKVAKLRQRLHQVTAGARQEDKLCNKTASALDFLLRYKHFSYILEALKNLETATRLSPRCCEQLVQSGATSVLFRLMRCCNRSVPCMDVISYCVQILLNLSKYHQTVAAVYAVDESIETLVDLLQRYRDKAGDRVWERKAGDIFTNTCLLLVLLLHDQHRAQVMMNQPKLVERVRSVYRLTMRKHKMDAQRNATKHKMDASINSSFYTAATPRKPRPQPRFCPDWVLVRGSVSEKLDPLGAVQLLADSLSINL